MPYRIEKRGSEWCVLGPNRNHGCHDSREKAIRQQRLLYVKAPESLADGGQIVPDVMITVSEYSQLASISDDSIRSSTGFITPQGQEEAARVMTGKPFPVEFVVNTSPASVTIPPVEAATVLQELEPTEPTREPWEGILGIEASPTGDGRILVRDEIFSRQLPVPFRVQIQTAEGHDGAYSCGRIEYIEHVPLAEFDRATEFDLTDTHPDALIIWGEGTLDGSEYAEEAKRLIENGAGLSLDGLHFNGKIYDATSLDEVDATELEMEALFAGLMEGAFLQGVIGEIGGVTIVDLSAFKEAKAMMLTASGTLHMIVPDRPLVASAGPLKPPPEWFENPSFQELTPLIITKEGRVYGHLCDWDGCHTGFQGICVPPFRSPSGYANFNVGGIEAADGTIIPCGKIMFSRDGVGHAPLTAEITLEEVKRHYDDATMVGAFVHAGEDRFGTWIAGVLRSDLNDLEVQHLRTHPPSGDWRPVKGLNDLVAAIAVPIPGFPIARQALVASANGVITGVITAPLFVEPLSERTIYRRRKMVADRVRTALGRRPSSRARMREEMMRAHDDG